MLEQFLLYTNVPTSTTLIMYNAHMLTLQGISSCRQSAFDPVMSFTKVGALAFVVVDIEARGFLAVSGGESKQEQKDA